MKIGLFGGSFDPVHLGHLLAAQSAFERGGLDRLIFIPAAQAPLKERKPVPASVRLDLLRASLEGDPRFEVSDFEAQKDGVCYSVDTARHFAARFPQEELFWILGTDQVAKLDRWKEIETLAKLVTFLVLERPGHPAPQEPEIHGLRLLRCEGNLIEMSSSEVRDRLARGLNVQFHLPHKAVEYLRETSHYR